MLLLGESNDEKETKKNKTKNPTKTLYDTLDLTLLLPTESLFLALVREGRKRVQGVSVVKSYSNGCKGFLLQSYN